MIELENLSLVKKGNILLKDLSLSLPTSSISLILGKSGSGKTSILRCISQIEQSYSGEILYRGENVGRFSRKKRCQTIGFVPQAYSLFPFMNVLENCAHPLRAVLGHGKKQAQRIAEERLSSLEMDKFLLSFPHELSGGQQQRVSIIRALLLRPVFLLFDEPTSALDPENTNLLIEMIFKLKAEGKGIIISSQDMAFAKKILDRVSFLEGGRLIEHYTLNDGALLPKESKLNQFLSQAEFSSV